MRVKIPVTVLRYYQRTLKTGNEAHQDSAHQSTIVFLRRGGLNIDGIHLRPLSDYVLSEPIRIETTVSITSSRFSTRRISASYDEQASFPFTPMYSGDVRCEVHLSGILLSVGDAQMREIAEQSRQIATMFKKEVVKKFNQSLL